MHEKVLVSLFNVPMHEKGHLLSACVSASCMLHQRAGCENNVGEQRMRHTRRVSVMLMRDGLRAVVMGT